MMEIIRVKTLFKKNKKTEIAYKCPFTRKVILTVDSKALRFIENETPCPDCKISHPLSICPREIIIDDEKEIIEGENVK